MDNFLAVNVVGVVDLNYSYVRVGYLTEVLVALLCVENRYGNCNLLNLRRDLREVDDDSLVVAVALAGAVVAGVDYRAVSAVEIVIEYKVLVAENLAVCSQKEHARVKVEIAAAVVLVGVPAETDPCQSYGLVKTYALTLRKIYCHFVFLLENHICCPPRPRILRSRREFTEPYLLETAFAIPFLMRSTGIMEIAITSTISHSAAFRP